MKAELIGKDVIQFSVEDEGPGVPDALREKIFQPWVKLTEATVSGVGLGLAISMSVVQGLNGTIGCGDRADGIPGARFWFRIPYCKKEIISSSSAEVIGARDGAQHSAASKQPSSLRQSAQWGMNAEEEDREEDEEMRKWYKTQHVVIVEDNIVNEKMLRAMLNTVLTTAKDKLSRSKEEKRKRKKEQEPRDSEILSNSVGVEGEDTLKNSWPVASDGMCVVGTGDKEQCKKVEKTTEEKKLVRRMKSKKLRGMVLHSYMNGKEVVDALADKDQNANVVSRGRNLLHFAAILICISEGVK